MTSIMKNIHMGTVTIQDVARADRRAARLDEIERHGRPVEGRTAPFRCRKRYDRNEYRRIDNNINILEDYYDY